MTPCPMPSRRTVGHHFLEWRTEHKMGAADVAYRAGLSCRFCHQTWTTFERCQPVNPPRPSYP